MDKSTKKKKRLANKIRTNSDKENKIEIERLANKRIARHKIQG